MASRQIICFNINGEYFGIDIDKVDSIVPPMEIFKVPNIPDFIEGLINLRNKVYTVFSLRKRFGLSSREADESTKIIIVNENSTSVGFIVDEINEIVKVEEGEIDSTPKTLASLKNKYVSGVAKLNSKIVLLLDIDHILSLN
jgi:purine-binding chemotaxis protein CheW